MTDNERDALWIGVLLGASTVACLLAAGYIIDLLWGNLPCR